jgi:hypothetical protein
MIYLARKGTEVVHHTNLDAMKTMDGIDAPDLTVPESEFELAEGLIRIIDGEIILGKTAAELTAEKANARLQAIDAELQSIDAKSGRPARAVAAAIAKGEIPNPADVARLEEYEQKSVHLRSELNSLKSGVAG